MEEPEFISRKNAAALSLVHYYTGKPCGRGHITTRFVSNGGCVSCSTDKKSAWRTENRDQYLKTNREHNRRWNEANKEKRKDIVKKSHKKHYSEWLDYQRSRRRNNINVRIAANLRSRLSQAIHGVKYGSAIKDLGCSIEVLKKHLETLFNDKMNWDNYGLVWQIDHKKPLCRFDLTDQIQLKIVCHYTNLQPLLIEDHIEKTKKDRI